jgi:hypothetical protein
MKYDFIPNFVVLEIKARRPLYLYPFSVKRTGDLYKVQNIVNIFTKQARVRQTM